MCCYIPCDLLWQILVRLPAKSLFQSRSVCKKWLLIIDDSDFIKAHTKFNQLYSDHTLLVRNKKTMYSFSLDSLNFNSGPQMIDATLIKYSHLTEPEPEPFGFGTKPFGVAFCNGLILMPSKKDWAIFNPLTKECHKMCQPLNANAALTLYSFGFGYDCSADDYKVVRIDKVLSQGTYVFQTLIYSLKLDSWRIIKDFIVPCSGTTWQVRATFLDGTLYWSSHFKAVVALDLSTERFCQFPLPSVKHENRRLRMVVGLDGYLFCYDHYNYKIDLFDVWVMEDNGVEKSWSRKFSFQLAVLDTPMTLCLVAYLKNKEQLVVQYERGFLWCDIKSNCVKKFSVHGFPHIAYCEICPGSLVRFNLYPRKWKRKIFPIGKALRECKRKICPTSLVHGSSSSVVRAWKRKMKTKRDTRLICVEDVGEIRQ